MEKYASRYRDAWYGTITIERAGEGLNVRFDNTLSITGKLEHVRYDTFCARWTDCSCVRTACSKSPCRA